MFLQELLCQWSYFGVGGPTIYDIPILRKCLNENKGVGSWYAVVISYDICTYDYSQGSDGSTDWVVMDPWTSSKTEIMEKKGELFLP